MVRMEARHVEKRWTLTDMSRPRQEMVVGQTEWKQRGQKENMDTGVICGE